MSLATKESPHLATGVGLDTAMSLADIKLAIIGLGYVGLPLAMPWYIAQESM